MIAPRTSAESRRVYLRILRGHAVSGADLALADAITAKFDGRRVSYWPAVLGIPAGIACVALAEGSGVRYPWVYSLGGALWVIWQIYSAYSAMRVKQFRAARTLGETAAPQYSRITLTGWHAGFQQIPFTRLLKQDAGLGLRDAKRACDELRSGIAIQVTVLTPRSDGFLAEARRLGVKDANCLANP